LAFGWIVTVPAQILCAVHARSLSRAWIELIALDHAHAVRAPIRRVGVFRLLDAHV